MTVNVTNTVGANNTIVLDGSSKIPAIDGSQVTALSGSAFTTGTLATARIDVGTGANQILQLDANAKLPALSATNLTNIPGPTVSTSDPAIDTNSTLGAKWVNKTSGEVYICTDATTGANVWTNVGAGTGNIQFFHGKGTNYGYCVGGYPPHTNLIQKYSYASDSDAVDALQDMNVSTSVEAGSCSSATYGYMVIQGGGTFSSQGTITKFQFNTSNNMTTVGNLTTGTTGRNQLIGTMSSTYGYAMGGGEPTELDVIDKFPFASDVNATDVGNLTQSRRYGAGTCSFTHGYYAGGMSAPPYWNIIDKWAFATDANATDVGNLTVAKGYMNSGVQSETYGYCAGGTTGSASNVIEKWSYATDANATDVGDLLDSVNSLSCTNSATYGYRQGGSSYTDRIDKWSLSTDGNATDVGNLLSAIATHVGCQY